MEAPSNPVSLHYDRCYHSGRTYPAFYAASETVSESDKNQKSEKYVSAFLGPDLWDETYDNADFSLEYMDLVDFLTENGFPKDHQISGNLNKEHTTNPQLCSGDHSPRAIDSPPPSDPQMPPDMFCCSSLQVVPSQTCTFPSNGQQVSPDKFPKHITRATPSPPTTFSCSSPVISSPTNRFASSSPSTDKYSNHITRATPSPVTFPYSIQQTIPSSTDTFPCSSPQLIPSPTDKNPNAITQVMSVTPKPLPCSSQEVIPSPTDACPSNGQQVSPSAPDTCPNHISRLTKSNPTTFPKQLPSLQPQLDVSQYDKLATPLTAVAFPTSYSPVGSRDESVDLSVTQRGVCLVDFEGLENFDPRERTFSEDELKPQPMFKKSRKIFVPDNSKDDKYWCRRKKNNVAAKRSRDARRIKENQIAMRAAFLEKENSLLRIELEKVKKENAEILISLTEFEALET